MVETHASCRGVRRRPRKDSCCIAGERRRTGGGVRNLSGRNETRHGRPGRLLPSISPQLFVVTPSIWFKQMSTLSVGVLRSVQRPFSYGEHERRHRRWKVFHAYWVQFKQRLIVSNLYAKQKLLLTARSQIFKNKSPSFSKK